MKKLFTLIAILAINFTLFSQAPPKLSYQAVIRNSSGGLVVNQVVSMKISILQGTETGTAVYVETHTTTTNANGLATIEIGGGSAVSGTFATINWGSGTYYLKTEADPAGGTSYPISGTSQLLSVPYALFSKSSADGFVLPYSGSTAPPAGGAVFQVTDNNTTSGSMMTYGLRGVSNSDKGIGVLGEAKSTSGKVWGIYGTTSSPSGIGVEGTAPDKGVYGLSTSENGYGVYGEAKRFAVHGQSTGTSGIAVKGEATGTASVGVQGFATNSSGIGVFGKASVQGVYGEASSLTGRGLFGYATSETGETCGIYAESKSVAGYGVFGKAPTYGVYGIVTAVSGNTYGVYGISGSDNGRGVKGEATSTTGYSVGVYGSAEAINGSGVYGMALHTSGINNGGYFKSLSSSGYGVYGESPKFGVYGKSSASAGRALMGEATGTGSIGVYGKALADNSTGVWGEGAKYDFLANGPGIDYGTGSSIRWKSNVIPIPDPLGKIAAIRGVFFDWDERHGGKRDVGMIAEEVGKVLPEIVVYEENGVDAFGMDYSKITPLLIEAIKAQQKEIESLRARLEKMEEKIGK